MLQRWARVGFLSRRLRGNNGHLPGLLRRCPGLLATDGRHGKVEAQPSIGTAANAAHEALGLHAEDEVAGLGVVDLALAPALDTGRGHDELGDVGIAQLLPAKLADCPGLEVSGPLEGEVGPPLAKAEPLQSGDLLQVEGDVDLLLGLACVLACLLCHGFLLCYCFAARREGRTRKAPFCYALW